MKRLFLDIEVSPDVVLSWRTGWKIDVNYDGILKERTIICVCWQWDGESRVGYLTWDKNHNDKALLKELIPHLNKADEIVGHYINGFDMPWIKTRALFHGLPMLPKYHTIDTKAWASKHFLFNSNKLDYIAKFLGSTGKIHTDYQLWKDVMNDVPGALMKMVNYCVKDIRILKFVHSKLSAMVPHKTHEGMLQGKAKWSCPKCGSQKIKKSKTRVTASGTLQHQMQCLDCGAYFSISDTVFKAYEAF